MFERDIVTFNLRRKLGTNVCEKIVKTISNFIALRYFLIIDV